ncbi:MAG: FMN-binding protein [Candidatus Hydrogenedentes bacterium]|nr:FMN-binding protein [Candidatus Hydrogenedentota bacterium]
MSEQAQSNPLVRRPVAENAAAETRKMILTLSSVAALSGMLIVGVYQYTLPYIEANREAMIEKAVFTVVPGGVQKRAYGFSDGAVIPDPASAGFGERFYAVYGEDRSFLGTALEASAQGYQDTIRILYGYSPEKACVVGMTVLESKETPGLGDKIDLDPVFKANFKALDAAFDSASGKLVHEVTVTGHGKKINPWEIDAISGATISSKAVGAMINRSLQTNLPRLLPHVDALKENTP